MNTTAAALEANVTVATIRTWCRHGAVAAVKAAGRWVIDTASLAARIAIGKLKARKDAMTDEQKAQNCEDRKRQARARAAALNMPRGSRAVRHPAYKAHRDLLTAASYWDRAAVFYASDSPTTRYLADSEASEAQRIEDRAIAFLNALQEQQ